MSERGSENSNGSYSNGHTSVEHTSVEHTSAGHTSAGHTDSGPLLEQQAMAKVLEPIESSVGLPNGYYTDPVKHQEQLKKVLANNWLALAFTHDVPNRGDAVPIESCGMPLLLVRGDDDIVRVFHNVCRHRGMILVEKPKHFSGVIRCPYHSWCYSKSGSLISTPHVGGAGQNTHAAIDRRELGLLEVAAYVWMNVVYVNLSGTADEFPVVHAAAMERWREFDQPLYFSGSDSEFELVVNGNWKLAVENYAESYHLPWVHPGLNSYSKLEDHYNIVGDAPYSGQGSTKYTQIANANGARFPDFDKLSTQWNEGAEYLALFPNVLLGVHRDHYYAIILEPTSMTQTRERVAIYYAQEEAIEDKYAELRKENAARWKSIFVEDIFVVEGMQKGRAAPAFDGGHFSPVMDDSTYRFHRWVASAVTSQ